MERLTEVNCRRCHFMHEDNGNCTAVGGFCTAVTAAHCPLLRRYLDTGLTPEDCAEYKKFEDEIIASGKTFGRLIELLNADKDGRLVVLPCKDWLDIIFGDQILFWGIDTGYEEEPIREISLDDADRIGWYDGYKTVFLKGTDENGEAWEFLPDEIGKTVFLTREEAEMALEGKQ